jgi:hypothetical protein
MGKPKTVRNFWLDIRCIAEKNGELRILIFPQSKVIETDVTGDIIIKSKR